MRRFDAEYTPDSIEIPDTPAEEYSFSGGFVERSKDEELISTTVRLMPAL